MTEPSLAARIRSAIDPGSGDTMTVDGWLRSIERAGLRVVDADALKGAAIVANTAGSLLREKDASVIGFLKQWTSPERRPVIDVSREMVAAFEKTLGGAAVTPHDDRPANGKAQG